MALPEPWKIPSSLFKEYLRAKNTNAARMKNIYALHKQLSEAIKLNEKIVDLQLDMWWIKVEPIIEKYIEETGEECVAGMEVDEKRQVVQFLSERAILNRQIQDLPQDVQNLINMTIGQGIPQDIPSEKEITKEVDSFLKDLFKK